MRLLVVEDDPKIASDIRQCLTDEGFAVDLAADGLQGFDKAMAGPFDAAIVDVMLPRMDGLELVTALRDEGNELPILILSAKGSVDDRVKGLQLGGDDYLPKPFSYTELLARVHALLRRSKSVAEPSVLSAGDLTIDLVRRSVHRANREIELQPKEFVLLAFLVQNKGRIVSKVSILDHVWGLDFEPQTNVIESRISRLREKVDRGFEEPLIKTVRGAGYVVED